MSETIQFMDNIGDHDKIVKLRVMYKSGDDAYFWSKVDGFKFKKSDSVEWTPVCVPAPIYIGLDDIVAIYAIRYSTVGELKSELKEEGYVVT